MTEVSTLFKATSIQAYGSLQKVLVTLHWGFLHLIIDEERSERARLTRWLHSIESDGVCLRCIDEVRAQPSIEASYDSRESRILCEPDSREDS